MLEGIGIDLAGTHPARFRRFVYFTQNAFAGFAAQREPLAHFRPAHPANQVSIVAGFVVQSRVRPDEHGSRSQRRAHARRERF